MADDAQMMDVTMPDGVVMKGVPVGTPKDIIMQKYTASKGGAAPAPQQAPEAPKEPGLMSNIGADLSKRAGQMGDVVNRADKQNPISTGLQGIGAMAGAAGDVMGDVAKSAYKAAPDVGGFKEKISGGIEKLAATPMGQAAITEAKKGGLQYVEWAKEHPEAARNAEALVDIASFFPARAAAKPMLKAAGEVSALAPIAKGIAAPGEAKMANIVDTMHKSATNTIEKAKNAGVVFHPDTATNMMAGMDKIPDLSTEGERSTRQETVRALDSVRKSVEGGDTSLKNLLGFRDKLTQIASTGGQDGTAAIKARNILDKHIDEGKVVAGDPAAKQMIKDFRTQWGRYKTGEDVMEAAKLSDESSAKSRKAFQKIVDSEYFKSLSPEVQKLATVAAKGKATGKFLDAVGSIKNLLGAKVGKHLPLLEAGGAILSGHPGVAAGIGTVMGAGKSGKLIQKGVSADVLRALQEGK